MAAACDERGTKRARTARQGWSARFPNDLLFIVYSLIASPRGRARFAAVCRSWRAAARAAPPVPARPWLLFSALDNTRTKALHCLEDGALVRLRLPGRCIVGGHDGGWVAVPVSPGSVRVVNLFSGAEVPLAANKTMVCPGRRHARGQPVVVSRVVFSAPPTSPQCILAAVTYNCGIALCRAGCPKSGWTVQGCHRGRKLADVTFCNGELYGLCNNMMKLMKFEIGMDNDGAPVITAKRRLVMQSINRTIHTGDYSDNFCYIFDLEGKLAMAMKNRWLPNIQPFFKVFKLADIRKGKQKAHKWLEVTSLGDYALFLGESFSKAVRVSATNMRGGVERNRIYYSRHCWLGGNTIIPSDKVFLKISNDDGSDMTCYKDDDSKSSIIDDNVKRIMSVGYIVQGSLHGGMWILPPDMLQH